MGAHADAASREVIQLQLVRASFEHEGGDVIHAQRGFQTRRFAPFQHQAMAGEIDLIHVWPLGMDFPLAIDGELQLCIVHPRNKGGAAVGQGRAFIQFEYKLWQVVIDRQHARHQHIVATVRVDRDGVAIVSQTAQGFADIPRVAHVVRLGTRRHGLGYISQAGRTFAQGIGNRIVHDSLSLMFRWATVYRLTVRYANQITIIDFFALPSWDTDCTVSSTQYFDLRRVLPWFPN